MTDPNGALYYERSLIEVSLDPLVTISSDGKIMDVNRATEQVTGLPRSELIGTDFCTYFTDPEKARDGYRRVFAEGFVEGFPLSLRHVSGTVRDVLYNAAVFRDENGEVAGAFAAARDISELKRIEHALRESEQRFRDIAESSSDWFFETDAEGRITYLSPQFEDITGLPVASYVGRYAADSIDSTLLDKSSPTIVTAMERRQPFTDMVVPLRRPKGGILWIAASGKPIFDGNGAFLGYRGTSTDITQRRQAEEALRRHQAVTAAVLNVADSGISVVDHTGTIILINEELAKHYGAPPFRIVGHKLHEFLGEEAAELALHHIRKARDKRATVHYGEYRNGRWFEHACSPIIEPGGWIERVATFDRDVTERWKAEDALRLSEDRYRSLVELLPHGVEEIDTAGTILYANPARHRMLGFRSGELVGLTLFDLLPEEERENAKADLARFLAEPAGQQALSGVNLTRDGRIIDVEIHRSAKRDRMGTVIGFVSVITDVTERRHAEAALRQSELRFRLLTDNASDFISLQSADGTYLYASPACERLLGYRPEEMVGRSAYEFFHPEDLDRIRLSHDAALDSRNPGVTFRTRRKDGELIWLESRAGYIPPANGGGGGEIVTVSRDVTDRVRAEEKLQDSMAALTRANEDLKTFTHIVSHDLRSPLINIKGFVAELDRALTDVRAMLTHMIDPEDARLDAVDAIFNVRAARAMEFISMATTKMDTLLNAVLQISRLGRRDPVIEPVDVRELVLKEVEALAFQISETATEVHVGALPIVQADRPTLELVFRNLLSNAIKYLVPGRPGRIEVTAEAAGRAVEFHVRDNGRGIAERHLAKVFAIFQRVGDQSVPGEGVGLTYVETALRRCGGSIRVESQPGEGSTFSVTIPGGTLDPPVTTSGS